MFLRVLPIIQQIPCTIFTKWSTVDHDNKETTITQNNTNKYHNVEQNWPDQREYIVYSLIYTKYKSRVEVRRVIALAERGGQ